MKKTMIMMAMALSVFYFATDVMAGYEAKEKECVAKCEAAAKMIKEDGLAEAICEINDKEGGFAGGDIYVYMMNMDAVMMAHPVVPSLIGKNLSGVVLKDRDGKEHPMMVVNFAKNIGAGWIEYMWTKPGEKKPSPKACYILKVEGTNVLLAAGFYKDK